MRYTLNTCTVSKFSQILKDECFVTKWPLPRFICTKMRLKLVLERNKNSLQDNEQKEILNDYYRMSLYVRILLLQTVKRSLGIKESIDAKKLFKEYVGRDFDVKSWLSNIDNKIKKLIMQYDNQAEVEEVEFNFDTYIAAIESKQDKKDLSQVFMYQLPIYEEAALRSIKQSENDQN